MRIAQLTDLHLRHHLPGSSSLPVRRSRRGPELLRAALADARQQGADVVVVTGDLVDVPDYLFDRERPAHTTTDATLWAATRADYRLIVQLLDESGLPWIVVPGNHDSQTVLAEVLDERSGGAARVVDHGGVRFVSFWDREWDFHVPQRVLAERERFDGLVADPDPTPQVHLQHYPITPALNEGYHHTYREGEWLRDQIASSRRIALALSGHYHPGWEPEVFGTAMFSITPALCEAPHRYRLFDLDPQTWADTSSVQWQQVALEPAPQPRPCVFLDRDGCINTLPSYNTGPGAMALLPGAASAIRRLRSAGYAVVVVTNQSCIGAGHVTQPVLNEVNDRMEQLLAAEGAEIDALYATHQAGEGAVLAEHRGTDELKPSPVLLQRAAEQLHLDLSRSWMVGDRLTDLEAGRAAGARAVLVRTGHGGAVDEPVEHAVDDLAAAADLIVGTTR